LAAVLNVDDVEDLAAGVGGDFEADAPIADAEAGFAGEGAVEGFDVAVAGLNEAGEGVKDAHSGFAVHLCDGGAGG
jgi:hypothetical protein